MATSSITRNFVVTGREKVEAFANALEESANAKVPQRPRTVRQLTDSNEIRAFMIRVKEKHTNG